MERFEVKYKEEATELIEGMEKSLLEMENNHHDPALIEDVFRNMHTLKGNSSMFGFKLIADFTHHLESVYDLIRSGEIQISKQILNTSFSALDHLSLLINNSSTLNESEAKTHQDLSNEVINLSKATVRKVFNNESPSLIDERKDPTQNELKNFRIHFQPNRNFFFNGSNPISIINELRELGECNVVALTNNIPTLENCEVDNCYTAWDIHLITDKDLQLVEKVFEFVRHSSKVEIHEIAEKAASVNSLEQKFTMQGSMKEDLSKNKNVLLARLPEVQTAIAKKHVISSIRVSSERLDSLMNLVSELMTLQAKLGTLAEQNPPTELLGVSENLEKISTQLRDNAFSMCLVPIENMVTPFHRLVRDLASELNKEIDFITEGTETELDKNIMEGLSDPLMHLLRNSVDHGIEDREARLCSGKPAHGKIIFSAYCAGTNVYIEIHDDGKGIDPEKIRKKAIEKGIIGAADILSEKEIFNLIFLPGFSTAEQVSGISGRGVGMDVVKRRIADIRGQIRINSQLNIGTTITIKLPITVSIIDGLLVKINDADFVIPVSSVERCHEITAGQYLNRFNNLIVLDGEQIPFISLSEEFDGTDNSTCSREIVIICYDEKKVGLIVDRVVGKFQAVLKPLGKYFLQMDTISGATILGNGKIALVLDTNNVTEQFLNKKNVYSC